MRNKQKYRRESREQKRSLVLTERENCGFRKQIGLVLHTERTQERKKLYLCTELIQNDMNLRDIKKGHKEL